VSVFAVAAAAALWTIVEIKMATGGHLKFLGQGDKICNNIYQTVFVPPKHTIHGEKIGYHSVMVAEARP